MKDKGFTLIEMVLAIAIGAIILAVAGLGLVNVAKGLIFAEKNAATTLKAQVALTRLEKEMHIITSIDNSSTATAFTFTNNKGGGSSTYTVSQSGNNIVLTGATADNLIDNVVGGSLSFSYFQSNGTNPAVPAGNAKLVKVDFTLTGAEGVQSPFSMLVRPRNL